MLINYEIRSRCSGTSIKTRARNKSFNSNGICFESRIQNWGDDRDILGKYDSLMYLK